MDFDTIDLTRKRKKDFMVILPKGRIDIHVGEDRNDVHVSAQEDYQGGKSRRLLPLGALGSIPTNKAISVFIEDDEFGLKVKDRRSIQLEEGHTCEFEDLPMYAFFVPADQDAFSRKIYMKVSNFQGVSMREQTDIQFEPLDFVVHLSCI